MISCTRVALFKLIAKIKGVKNGHFYCVLRYFRVSRAKTNNGKYSKPYITEKLTSVATRRNQC